MKIYFPDYTNFVPDWKKTSCEREADENNHYQCMEDITKYINYLFLPEENEKNGNEIIKTNNKKRQILNDLQEDIQQSIINNKICKFVCVEFNERKKNIEGILRQYPIEIKEFWKQETNKLVEIEQNNKIKSNAFVYENAEKIFTLISDIKDEIEFSLKEKKRDENERYREKIRVLQGKEKRVLLSDEEKKEKKKLSQIKFKEKNSKPPRVLLSDEEKKENKKLSQIKFKEKNNKPPRVLLSDEEKREKKKLANQKYREQVKQKVDE